MSAEARGTAIYFAGTTSSTDEPSDFFIGRVDGTGALDSSFGVDGIARVDFGPGRRDVLGAIRVLEDGRIVSVGNTGEVRIGEFALARTAEDGSLDTTFDGDGRARFAVPLADNIAKSVAEDRYEKVLVAGSTWTGTIREAALVQTAANGTLDAEFGTGGVLRFPMGESPLDVVETLLARDGRIIIVAGSGTGRDSQSVALARIWP